MHPLFDNLKSFTFEELEKKSSEIHRRMQMYARNQMNNPLIWNQLQQMHESILMEKQERAQLLNAPHNKIDNIVINTDPLEDDLPAPSTTRKPNTFNPIS
jgi:hypothetical protein